MGSFLRIVQVGVLASPYPANPRCIPPWIPLKVRKTSLTATLVMPESSRMPHHGKRCRAGTSMHPSESELETGMTQALPQVFESVDVVEDKRLATRSDVIIEMTIPDLQAEGHRTPEELCTRLDFIFRVCDV